MHASSLMRRGNRVARLEPRERRQDVVQQLRQHVGQRGAEQVDAQAVEQVRDRAEEVAEEIAGAWDRRDVEDHFIEVDGEPKQIQIEGPRSRCRIGQVACATEGSLVRSARVPFGSTPPKAVGAAVAALFTGISTMAPATCCAAPVAGVIVPVRLPIAFKPFSLTNPRTSIVPWNTLPSADVPLTGTAENGFFFELSARAAGTRNAAAARKGRATRLNASILDLRLWSTTLPSACAVRHLAGTPASPANGAARHGR